MHTTHIRKVDIGLLRTLQALVEERSIGRAAERMFLSQPAMSRALDRLQQLFGDDLLVRRGQGYDPTLRAMQIYAELERLLPRIEGLINGNYFDPATSTDRFRIATTDLSALVLFPPIMEHICKVAPGVSIEIVPSDEEVFRKIETNAVDLALWMNAVPGDLRAELMFEDRFACLVRNNHPIGRKPVTLARYLECAHVLITTSNPVQGIVDRQLEERSVARRVRLRLPYFAAAAAVVERTDMIVTLPYHLALHLAKTSHTEVVPAPAEFMPFRYQQVWHPRFDADPAHQWLRSVMRQIIPPIGGGTHKTT
jgi:DNA-binding transcriptional LysR family regulator